MAFLFCLIGIVLERGTPGILSLLLLSWISLSEEVIRESEDGVCWGWSISATSEVLREEFEDGIISEDKRIWVTGNGRSIKETERSFFILYRGDFKVPLILSNFDLSLSCEIDSTTLGE